MKELLCRKTNVFLVCALLGLRAHAESQLFPDRITGALKEGSVSNLSAIVIEAASLFADKPTLYFQSADRAANALELLATTNLDAGEVLVKHSAEALGRSCPKDPLLAIECFTAKANVAYRLARVSHSVPSQHVARALAQFLGELRTTAISNYMSAEVRMNVVPPIIPTRTSGSNYTLYFAGMDPKAITDPNARSAYERAISENSRRTCLNDLQLVILPRIESKITPIFLNYIRNLFELHREEMRNFDSLAAVAHLTSAERERF